MAITLQGIESPLTLNLQDFDRQKFGLLQDQISNIEGNLRTGLNTLRRNTANQLREFDKDIQLGADLIGSFSRDLNLNKQGYQFDVGNLQDQQSNLEKQHALDFETKMRDFAFQQEQQLLKFQQDFDAISFRADQADLRYDEEIDVLTARLEAEKEAITASARGNKAVLEAQIKSAQAGRRAQTDIQASLDRTIGLVEDQGRLAIRHANIQGQIAFLQQRAMQRRGRFSRFKFQESRAIRRATMGAVSSLAEAPGLIAQAEQDVGLQFEAEMSDVVAGIEQAKSRREQAVISAQSAEIQTKQQKEGIGRQKRQSEAQYEKLGYAIEGYEARIQAIDDTVKAQTKGADKTLEIRRDYAGRMKKRAKKYYDSAKSMNRKMASLARRTTSFNISVTQANYGLQKSRTQIYFDKQFNNAYFGFMNTQSQLQRSKGQAQIKTEYAAYQRSLASQKYADQERAYKKLLHQQQFNRMRLEANIGTHDEGTFN